MEVYCKRESFLITGAAMQVYNTLGSGFLEAVYQEALEIEFKKRNIPYEREKELTLDDSHRAQVYNYLKATGYKLGLLYNFGNYEELEWERKVK